jgi:ElaB/YqjD/DUF883 family membrane-anchored ribosome-binding protein
MKKLLLITMSLMLIVACETVKLGALEQLGYEKREVLTGRIEKARDSQEEAKEQFESALEQFKSVVSFDGGDLEDIYNQLNDEYEDSKASAEEVRERIDSVEYVAKELFEEWQDELNEYSNQELRRQSEQNLLRTKREYATLIKKMKRAESSIQPVLEVFQDRVLYLKHNLNARAINALRKELSTVENDVENLVSQMNQSINEANKFIDNMDQ